MELRIYNTLTKQKQPFIPLMNNQVTMYVCGPTVYNYVHLGNARVSVFFDVVRRYLEHLGLAVTYIQNLTDVDDRIIDAAKETNTPELELSSRFSLAYLEDLKALGVLPSHVHPKVSAHIPEIIVFIKGLIGKGLAYEVGGDVYFRVKHFSPYGKLTNQSIEHVQQANREGENFVSPKEEAVDFALWKRQKANEIAWDSPWGLGRPGWHIECSAMSRHYLGDTFDIHGGGLDLCFPHHENEMAQSEGLTGKPMANVWMHNHFVTVDGQKMSKSVGNFTTVRDALATFSGEAIRLFFLSVNYRNPIDYSEDSLFQADSNWKRLKNTVFNLKYIASLGTKKTKKEQEQEKFRHLLDKTKESFDLCMQDDFDTTGALTVLLDFSKKINIRNDKEDMDSLEAEMLLDSFQVFGNILGFDFASKEELLDAEIQKLVEERDQIKEIAKLEKDKKRKKTLFQQSDEIRSRLEQKGILLEDTPYGTRWKKK